MAKRVTIRAIKYIDAPWKDDRQWVEHPRETVAERALFQDKISTAQQWTTEWREYNDMVAMQGYNFMGVNVFVPPSPPSLPPGYYDNVEYPNEVYLD